MKKRDKLSIIHRYYPGALASIDCINLLIGFIEDELDLEPSSVMFADSICSDDVNSIQYPARASEFLGPFKMGGLDGFPFTGLTGMNAFASHVPDDGAVLIFYGPHAGVSKQGVLGEINRHGQHRPSDCCGAARAAVDNLKLDRIAANNITDLDYQMNTLEQLLLHQRERVITSLDPFYEATDVIYEAIDERIETLVARTAYQCRYVLLLGAVLVNSDSDMGSYIQPRKFQVLNLETNQRHDRLQRLNTGSVRTN